MTYSYSNNKILKTAISLILLSSVLVTTFAMNFTANAEDSRVSFNNGMIIINLTGSNNQNQNNSNPFVSTQQPTNQVSAPISTPQNNITQSNGFVSISLNGGNIGQQKQNNNYQPVYQAPTQPSNYTNNGMISINLFGAANSNNNTQYQNNSTGGESYSISDNELYSLPAKFNSADKINSFLLSQGSVLADYQMDFGFEGDDDILTTGRKDNYDPAVTMKPYFGTKMRFADFVWKLSQTNVGNVCSVYNSNTCFNKQMNPAFILAMIQRESGLVYGTNAKRTNETDFLIERATGYYCFETNNKAEGCWDENPSWRFYKGLFRQTYFMYRNLALNSTRCETTGINMNGNSFRNGSTVNVGGESIKLDNGMNCALYIYTPHAFAQKKLQKVFAYINK
jgi:hypothetical protein